MRESIVETLTRPAMPGLCFSCHFRNRNRRNCTLQGNGGCRANIVQLLRKRHQSVHTHIHIIYIYIIIIIAIYCYIYIYGTESGIIYAIYVNYTYIYIYIFLSRYLYKNQRVSNLFYNEQRYEQCIFRIHNHQRGSTLIRSKPIPWHSQIQYFPLTFH